MGEINVAPSEKQALRSIDPKVLRELVDQAMRAGNADALRTMRLGECGEYVSARLRYFATALAEHEQAKAPKKRAETENRLRRTRDDLVFAVEQMRARVDKEDAEGELFFVDDIVPPPFRLSEQMSVRVAYRWRATTADQWTDGTVTFVHGVKLVPDYTQPRPARKPSAASQERARQDALYSEWDHLRRLALHAVQDYFRQGRSGSTIPERVPVKADPATGGLNNFSADF